MREVYPRMTESAPSQNFTTISAQEALHIRSNALLLDVRTPAEYEDSHIDGAVLHPVTDLKPAEVAKAAQGRSCCIVICGSGGRATRAAQQLAAHNMSGVRVLEGGMKAWIAQKLPVIEGRKAISIERQVRIAAGSLVVLGIVLSQLMNPAWLILSAFVGAGLVFAGVTDTCGMALVLARMPWNKRTSCCAIKNTNSKPAGTSCSL